MPGKQWGTGGWVHMGKGWPGDSRSSVTPAKSWRNEGKKHTYLDIREGAGSAGPNATPGRVGWKLLDLAPWSTADLDKISFGGSLRSKPACQGLERTGGKEVDPGGQHSFWVTESWVTHPEQCGHSWIRTSTISCSSEKFRTRKQGSRGGGWGPSRGGSASGRRKPSIPPMKCAQGCAQAVCLQRPQTCHHSPPLP